MKTLRLMLVDDEQDDRTTFRRAATKVKLKYEVDEFSNADDALTMLRASHDKGCQYVVITDLKMPRKTGSELIAEVRADPRISATPMFILSSSNLTEDMRKSYGAGADGYLVKGCGQLILGQHIMEISDFCDAVRELPGQVRLPVRPPETVA